MNHAITPPAPRAFRLPRVKFKRPRWPRGSRLYLAVCVINFATLATPPSRSPWTQMAAAMFLLYGWLWWRSRGDDDGPSAT